MAITDDIQDAIDAAFAEFGEAATYTPDGGNPPAVTVIPNRADDDEDVFGETRLHSESAWFDVRVSEIAAPVARDTLLFDGTTYIIQGEPARKDSRRMVWTLNTRLQSP